MMKSSFFAAAALATFALATPVRAQSLDRFDWKAANLYLLQNRQVQDDMGVTGAQREKMNAHVAAAQKKTISIAEQMKREGKDPTKVKADDPILVKQIEALKKAVLQELTPTQLRRLREISLQQAGLAATTDAMVAQRIGISESTRARLASLYNGGRQRAVEMQRNVANEALKEFKGRKPRNAKEQKEMEAAAKAKVQASQVSIRPRVQKLQNQVQQQMLAILGERPLAALKKLQGKPFGKATTSFDPGR